MRYDICWCSNCIIPAEVIYIYICIYIYIYIKIELVHVRNQPICAMTRTLQAGIETHVTHWPRDQGCVGAGQIGLGWGYL